MGLFNGLCGTCGVLFDLGYKEEALNLLRNIDVDTILNEDISLYSGLSGIGVAFLSFYSITHEKCFLEMAFNVANKISKSFDKMFVTFESGLLYGVAGVVVFFDQLASVTKEKSYQSIAIDLMNNILTNGLVKDKENLFLSVIISRRILIVVVLE